MLLFLAGLVIGANVGCIIAAMCSSWARDGGTDEASITLPTSL